MTTNKTRKLTKDDFVEKARNPNTRVVDTNTDDTLILTKIATVGDAAFRRLRNQMVTTIPVEKAAAVIEKYNRGILVLDEAVEEAFGLMGIEYRRPYKVKQLVERLAPERIDAGETDKVKKIAAAG